jgi:hypothetical protein
VRDLVLHVDISDDFLESFQEDVFCLTLILLSGTDNILLESRWEFPRITKKVQKRD